MKLGTDEAAVLARFDRWASGDDRVRAALLTSNRATTGGARDLLSDYDIALIVSDVEAIVREEEWVSGPGAKLLRVRDVVQSFGLAVQSDMVLYDDGTKIDYTLWPLELAARIVEAGSLPDDFDDGYRVLLDKDRLARAHAHRASPRQADCPGVSIAGRGVLVGGDVCRQIPLARRVADRAGHPRSGVDLAGSASLAGLAPRD